MAEMAQAPPVFLRAVVVVLLRQVKLPLLAEEAMAVPVLPRLFLVRL
jgi:hypothetical protein